MVEVVYANAADLAKLSYSGLEEGFYVVGSGNTGTCWRENGSENGNFWKSEWKFLFLCTMNGIRRTCAFQKTINHCLASSYSILGQ